MKKIIINSVLRNVFSQTFGKSFAYFLNFLSITFAARYLGVEIFGNFASMLAIVIIISKIIDFGVSPIVFRDTTTDITNHSYINSALFIRALLFLITILIANLFLFTLNYPVSDLYLTNILLLNVIFSSRFMFIREILELFFKIDLKMHKVMIINLIDNVLLLVLVLLIPYFNAGIEYVVWSYTLSNLPGFILIILASKRDYSFRFTYITTKVRYLLRESYPLLGYVLLLALFNQADVLILKYFKSSYEAGIYSAAVRLTIPMSIIPIAIISTAMPSIIRKIKTTGSKNSSLEISIFKILFIFSFLIFALIAFKASEFVSIIFGSDYVEASLPTIILFGSNIFLFCNYFSLDLLTVHNKQKISFYYSLLIVVLDIFIIILLLRDYSYNGVAIAKLVAILSGFITLELIFYYRKFAFSLVNFKSLIFVICSIIVFYLLSFLNIVFYSLISLIISVLLVFLLKFFENDELRLLLKVINKEKWIEKFSRI